MINNRQNLDMTVIILTFNEELHIQRVIESAWRIATEVVIVDSYSKDKTVDIALACNARVLQHPFVNQAQQFQWAMEHGQINTAWTMRLDADEYLTPSLVEEIIDRLPKLPVEITGIVLKRQVHFMGQWIKHGGYYPIRLLRIWRTGCAVMEQKWMDEHMVLTSGHSVVFKHDFVDENLNTLTWWTAKHNDYATREAIDILGRQYNLGKNPTSDSLTIEVKQSGSKRWYKDNLYLRMPLFIRAFLYFQFRFWFRLGFLDGKKGLVWHFLQGFWYRFLVDAKIFQIVWVSKKTNRPIDQVLFEDFNVRE